MTRSHRQPCLAGIDVSAKQLHVAMSGADEVGTFENTPVGHKALIKALTKRGSHARVVVEATSTYHLDLALALARHKRCEVMVANPRATKHFHQAQGIRAKTDKVDARSLLEFVERMSFAPWTPPTQHLLELRSTTRYVAQMVKQQTRLKNQRSALGASGASPAWVLEDIRERLKELAGRIERSRERARTLARQDSAIQAHVVCLDSIPGIGPDTAVGLVAEFAVLDGEMTGKEITAWAGLDPTPRESGTSLKGRRPISKRGNARVRALLYMPAVTNTRSKGCLGDFYRRVEASSGHGQVALIAGMRKLLVIAWAIYRTGAKWDESRARSRTPRAEAA